MFRVYIVDDEVIVRQGLKAIINWRELGFALCGEAGDGLTAFKEIMELGPDLVLADIRMPRLSGLDLAQKLRANGYEGRFIVLSGYSEFEYAQEAISHNVDYYLTKPIDQAELEEAVHSIFTKLKERQLQSKHKDYYQEKAKSKILEEALKQENTGRQVTDSTLKELALEAEAYQVLILEKLPGVYDFYEDFCAELGVLPEDEALERHAEGKREIILLKGGPTITRFAEYKKEAGLHQDKPYILIAGQTVQNFAEISASYQEAERIRGRLFFVKQERFIVDKVDVAGFLEPLHAIALGDPSTIGQSLYEYITAHQQHECEHILSRLAENMVRSSSSVSSIKGFLAGLLIYIVQEFKKDYADYDLSFATSAELIRLIESKMYLTEIMDLIRNEIARMIEGIGSLGSDSILANVLNYIHHHYDQDLKLKTIARKFGYNSSYLGQIFNQKYKISFNDYLHQIRIEKAMELLCHAEYKVYEIANLVGYSNVDYFHVKFREYAGTTPARYKKGES